MMLRLITEWNDAPGVKDPVLAATWGRLEIRDESSSESKWPSRVIRSAANSLDRGVYLSLFPLAEWIVENWWFLLNESCRVPEFISGRSLANHPAQRAWVQRHNLLAAREGGALPDLTIYRDGAEVVLKWAPDPDQEDQIRPVQFIGQGSVYADPSSVERTLHQFVEAVLQRVLGNSDESTERMRVNWTAICQSRHDECAICSLSASLGVDPYDEHGLTDELVRVMQSRISGLQPHLQRDLVDATTPNSLVADLDWLDQAFSHITRGEALTNGSHIPASETAHQLGYRRADLFRKKFSLRQDAVTDLPKLLYHRCGWPAPDQQSLKIEGPTNLTALIAKDRHGNPRLIGPSLGHWAERFRLARSLYFLPDVTKPAFPRLVTRAYTWDQRASRAFAAELLAPAEALRVHVGDVVSAEEVEQLASQFGVRPTLIVKQIRNHKLADIDED